MVNIEHLSRRTLDNNISIITDFQNLKQLFQIIKFFLQDPELVLIERLIIEIVTVV